MTHPTEARLALFAGGDLNVVDRVRTSLHLRSCDSCRRDVEAFRDIAGAVRYETDGLPGNIRWDTLAAEMTANIHLGLEAGECVGPVITGQRRLGWRTAGAMACVTAVLAVAWWLNPPPRLRPMIQASGAQIRTTAAGLELNQNGNAMTLMHIRGKPMIVSAPGSLRARYVDSETGQITINNVYAD